MEPSPSPGLSLEDFQATRLRASLGDGHAKQQLAEIIEQNPAQFGGLLDMKGICLETMARALARNDEELKQDIDRQFAKRIAKLEPDHPVDAMERMWIDIVAITDLRALAFATHSVRSEHSAKPASAFHAIAKKTRSVAVHGSKELVRHWKASVAADRRASDTDAISRSTSDTGPAECHSQPNGGT